MSTHELSENVFGIGKVESTSAASTSGIEVECSRATGHAALGCERKAAACFEWATTFKAGAALRWRSATPQEEFEAILIIRLALFGVGENLVGLGDLYFDVSLRFCDGKG